MPVSAAMSGWLDGHIGADGPWHVVPFTVGRSHNTRLLRGRNSSYVLRRPPVHAVSASLDSMEREFRVLGALHATPVPTPQPIALCDDIEVLEAPFLVMEFIENARSITESLPPGWPDGPTSLNHLADALVDALVAIHRLDWAEVGLTGFGRPDGFLGREPARGLDQWRRTARRPLPAMTRLADWLSSHCPSNSSASLIHGSFHLGNCLVASGQPRLLAVVDWGMATIGDPFLDLGLVLALWGDRPLPGFGLPRTQAVSRLGGAPPREYLLERYQRTAGRPVVEERYYRTLALFKLAATVEGEYSQFLSDQRANPYMGRLVHDVPALLDEALITAGLAPRN